MISAQEIAEWLCGWERREQTRVVVRGCLLAIVLTVGACLWWASLLPTGVLGIGMGIGGLLCYPSGDLIATWWVTRGMSDEQRVAVHVLSACLSHDDAELWRRSSEELPQLREIARVLGATSPDTHEVVARFHRFLEPIAAQHRPNGIAVGGHDTAG